MNSTLRSEWQALRRSPAGQRFQRRYEHSRRSRNQTTIVGRLVRIGLAAIFLMIGAVLMFIPGPAILFFILAGSLLAAESRVLAKVLDAMEVWLRRLARVGARVWGRLSPCGKIAVAALVAMCAMTGSYFSWRILVGLN